jgi:nicotinate-nucleotide adenylyltransferase
LFATKSLKKIGIYGGSFDPIHHAHLILAREAQETFDLETVIFVLAAQSPFKDTPTCAALRWRMLKLALDDEPGFSASRLEIDRPEPSYSVETVEILSQEYPGAKLFFLLGEDNLEKLPSWHRFEDLRRLVQFVVLDRSGGRGDYPYPTVRRKIDISATMIRNRVASGRSIRYLVPEAVEELIRQEKLYQGNERSNPKI